jgi:hypothetical protein
MPYRWPADTRFTRLELVVEARWCRTCGGALTTGDQRQHRVLTLHGPLPLVCQLAPGPRHACPAQPQTIRPEAETAMAMPWGGPRLGCGLWAGPTPLCPPLVGRAAPCCTGRPIPDASVRRRNRDLPAPLPTDAGGPSPGSRPVGPRLCHIPPNYVVAAIPAHRKPPDVRICRLSIQSDVGTRPPSTSTPHLPAFRARCW